MNKENRSLLRAIDKARDFPVNTCPSSRHVEIIGDALAHGRPYPMLDEDPEHVAGSLLSVVASLYNARTEIVRLKTKLGEPPA